MAEFLPIAAPSWPCLRNLTLKELNFSNFPEGLAAVLVGLTNLNLANNQYARLPNAVKLLSNLQHLDMSGNLPLQVEEEDVDTLAALPPLQTLDISKSRENAESRSSWNDNSVVVFTAISERLPLLKLKF